MKRAGIISLMLMLLTATPLFGQAPASKAVESVVYFRFNKAEIDSSYKDNSRSLQTLDEAIAKHSDRIDSIVVTAYASPEGREAYNRTLSEQRALTMQNYLTNRFPDTESLLRVIACGEDFDGVVRMIENDPNVPYKSDVLNILRKADGRNNDRQFWVLSEINGGKSYRYIKYNILPALRTAASVVCYFSEPVELAATVTKRPVSVPQTFVPAPTEALASIPEIDYYTYIINVEDMYRIDSLSGRKVRRDDVRNYILTISNKEKEMAGEYSLVAPNGITNLSGWYSLASTPSSNGEAFAGGFTSAGEPVATYIALDSCKAVATQGAIKITHHSEDDRIDVEGEGITLALTDGTTCTYDLEQLDCVGDGLPSELTYVVTASPLDGVEGVSRYTVTVTDNFSGVVGEYSLVAPNGITNLSGWYSLTTTPETQGQAVAGSFAADGSTIETFVVVDGEKVVLREGTIGITHNADNTMDIVCENMAGIDADGEEIREKVEMLDVRGDGVPFTGERRADYATEEAAPSRTHGFALKTNLLYDAATALNIAVEVPMGNRLSVEASWTFPWWLPESWSWCNQMLWGEVEGRYWLGNRQKRGFLQGHFIGAYVGSGLYDFQFSKERGWQGEFIEAGLGYGFVKGLKSGLNLEFEVGFGFMQTDYRGYLHTQRADGSEVLYLYRQNQPGKPLQFFGPTKAKIALVWPITWQSRRANKQRVQNEN